MLPVRYRHRYCLVLVVCVSTCIVQSSHVAYCSHVGGATIKFQHLFEELPFAWCVNGLKSRLAVLCKLWPLITRCMTWRWHTVVLDANLACCWGSKTPKKGAKFILHRGNQSRAGFASAPTLASRALTSVFFRHAA